MDAVAQEQTAFGEFIAPVERSEFYDKWFGKTPLHIPGDPGKFADIMPWETLTQLLNQSALWTGRTLMLVLDRRVIPPEEYCIPFTLRDGMDGMVADMNKVRDWVKKGASLVLNDIETLTPRMKEVADVLGHEPGGRVQANLYCSWHAHQAFGVHYDTHDVFAFQVTGEKTWRIYQRYFKDPVKHPAFRSQDQAFHDAHCGAVSQEVEMTAGDLLYIPRGYYHDALTDGDNSIHLAVSLVPQIGLDLISAVFERAVHDELFRADIPRIWMRDGKATEEHMIRLAGRFRELVRDKEFMEQFMNTLRNDRFERWWINLPDDAKGD